jgi:hypothetical protein
MRERPLFDRASQEGAPATFGGLSGRPDDGESIRTSAIQRRYSPRSAGLPIDRKVRRRLSQVERELPQNTSKIAFSAFAG